MHNTDMEKYQTGWRRLGALCVDAIIVSLLCDAIIFIRNTGQNGFINMIAGLAYSVVPFIYYVYMHGRFGQTIGKFIARVKIITIEGTRITYKHALMRDIVPCLLLPVSIWVALYISVKGEAPSPVMYEWAYYIAFFWIVLEMVSMLLNEQRRAIHDFIADTVVVRVA